MENVDYIIHAAALKRVDTAEYNPLEFINTNIVGTSILLDEALNYYNSLSKYKRNNFTISNSKHLRQIP